ncbi:USP6 N-terminal-like protein [Oopsacas minuta]|uniref:USP6 N-terminal-like protein n=1 Tax=Oopsacas minuta TaxID=111878 RepID=A0AAV7KD48_9METZ|nr:USP6 N-terminal-like protein [Oopsacas minuta]
MANRAEKRMVSPTLSISYGQDITLDNQGLRKGNYTTPERRREILFNYDHGREGAVIEAWEDPNFDVYTHTDRHGFMHKRVPPTTSAKLQQIERERAQKWNKMIGTEWETKYRNSDKLRRRIYKGIPNSLRGPVWSKILALDSIKSKDIYERAKFLAREYSPDLMQIDVDVMRTLREHVHFRERYSSKQQALFHVLSAYSMFNKRIGYCQGMASVTGLLLMYLREEEEAFWALISLTNTKYEMHEMYTENMSKFHIFTGHHCLLRERLIPKIDAHFKKWEVPETMYLAKMLVQMFFGVLPYELVLRIWDAVFLDGPGVIMAASILILKMNKKTLLSLESNELLEYITVMGETTKLDHDKFMQDLMLLVDELIKENILLPTEPKPPNTYQLFQDFKALHPDSLQIGIVQGPEKPMKPPKFAKKKNSYSKNDTVPDLIYNLPSMTYGSLERDGTLVVS